MKTLVTIGSAISALFLGWHHYGVTESKNASESATELETTKSDVQTANAGVAQGSASTPAASEPATKTNWIQERNSNWQSSLGRGAYDNRHAVTIVPSQIVIVPSSSGTTGSGFSSGMRPPPGVRPSAVIRPPMNRPPSAPIPQHRPESLPSAPPSPPRGS